MGNGVQQSEGRADKVDRAADWVIQFDGPGLVCEKARSDTFEKCQEQPVDLDGRPQPRLELADRWRSERLIPGFEATPHQRWVCRQAERAVTGGQEQRVSLGVTQDLSVVLTAIDLDDKRLPPGDCEKKVDSPAANTLDARASEKMIERCLRNEPPSGRASESIRECLDEAAFRIRLEREIVTETDRVVAKLRHCR